MCYSWQEETPIFNITQQLGTFRRLENGESWCVVMASYYTGLYLWFRGTERPIMTVYGIKWKCEGPFKVTDIATASISGIRQMVG